MNANEANVNGLTALTLAVRSDGNPETIYLLLRAGAEISLEDATAYIVRHEGEETEACQRLQAIIEFGIKKKRKRLFAGIGITTMTFIVILATIAFFDTSSPSQEHLNNLIFKTISIRNKNNTDVEQLIKKGANVNARDINGRTPLMNAVISRPEAMSLLIENGADIDAYVVGGHEHGKTVLMFAVEKNPDPEVSRFLIEKGAHVNDVGNYGNTPLELAAIQGHSKVVALLIQYGADLNVRNNRGWTPVMELAHLGVEQDMKRESLSLLIDNGADVNARDNIGWTPLMMAVRENNGSLGTVAFLLEHGADINAKDNDGMTPLMHATAQESKASLNLVSLLIQKGASINEKDHKAWTPLIHAAAHENKASPELVFLLIQNGADINAKDNDGRTPLMHAAARPARENDTSPEVVSLLLIKGADVNARDNDGNTALSLAQTEAVERLLRSAGGVR